MDWDISDEGELDPMMTLDEFDGEALLQPISDLIEYCIFPVLQQSLTRLVPVICVTFILGEVLHRGLSGRPANVICIVSGLIVLQNFVDQREAGVLLLVTSFAYLWIHFSVKNHSRASYVLFVVMSLAYLVFREHVPLFGQERWAEVRGIAMIAFMKIISLIYEVTTNERLQAPSVDEFFSYVLFPATLPFGPWISFSDHSSLINHFSWNKSYGRWATIVTRHFVQAFAYLLMSTCIFTYLTQQLEIETTFGRLFFDAIMVRFSHYFICQLSEALLLLGGPRSAEARLNTTVASPFNVEFPRSLVDVVVNWNVPMHRWLKRHIYNPLRASGFKSTLAGVLTFLISAMLHGLNVNLTAVLVSLGLYCYFEYSFRQALATIFNACIAARPCHDHCGHAYRNTVLVNLANFLMCLLAMFNLAYLGALLDEGAAAKSPSITELWSMDANTFLATFDRWNEADYTSHRLMLALYTGTATLQVVFQTILIL